jgi:hypothetical protein
LIFKRGFEDVSLVALLLSVQAMEFPWVVLNYPGVERTTTEPIGHVTLLQIIVTMCAVWGERRRGADGCGLRPRGEDVTGGTRRRSWLS